MVPGSKVLVTGGCGFIGSHIVDHLLLQGYEVAVVDNLVTGKFEHIEGKPVRFYDLDILHPDFEHVVGSFLPDFIIHQAAQVSVAYSIQNMIHDECVNIGGSNRVLDAALKHNVKKIVYASSAAVYGEPKYLPIDLDHPILPKTPYGISKYTFEHYLRMAHELHGIDYTILRYANVYGPRQDARGEGGVISIFVDRLTKNEPIYIWGDGEQTRDFIYVEDVARANAAALTAGSKHTYHISSANCTSLNDLVQLIGGIIPPAVKPIYKDPRPGDIRHSLLCNQAAIHDLHWQPQFSLEDGLRKTIEYYWRSRGSTSCIA